MNDQEMIFSQYGFNIPISVKDTFTLTHVEGIFLLELKKPDGVEITARRKLISEQGETIPFNIRDLSPIAKRELIERLKKLDLKQAEISKLLGVSQDYISNLKRN